MEKNIFSFKGDRITKSSIEPILEEIKEIVRTEQLSKTVGHSLLSIISEITNNVACYAYQDGSNGNDKLEISLDDTIIHIFAQSLISNAYVGNITIWLNKMNLMSQEELKNLQQKTLCENLNYKGNASIGLIMVRRRICKPMICKFKPYNDDVSYTPPKMDLKKDLHINFEKEQTKRTPQVKFDVPNQSFEITGVSFPEDPEDYYNEIEEWIKLNEPYIIDMKSPILKIDLDYFNSISLKNIVRLVRDLISTNFDKFTINWYYDIDDEISHEEGIEMSEILHKNFNFIPKK